MTEAAHAERRGELLARINALAASAGFFGDPATGDLAYALEECVRGFAACGEGAIREAAAALSKAA
jgi:hypothetical protein